MSVFIALWLVCTSPDRVQCESVDDPSETVFKDYRQCMAYAKERSASLREFLINMGMTTGVVYYACVEEKAL